MHVFKKPKISHILEFVIALTLGKRIFSYILSILITGKEMYETIRYLVWMLSPLSAAIRGH